MLIYINFEFNFLTKIIHNCFFLILEEYECSHGDVSHEDVSRFTTFAAMLYRIFQKSLIIHEKNTKKNHKRVASLYVIEIPLIYTNFNFDFLVDFHNVFFENYFANDLTRSIVFEAI